MVSTKAHPEPPALESMPLTFCIVDDEREVCDVLRLYFESRGHRCHVAHDGASGLAMIEKISPDAVFLDLQMPKMNGLEVLTALREKEGIKHLPVMMMTGLTKEEKTVDHEQLARSANANAFLTKPFQLDELLESVEKMLGHAL